jgi:ABC-type nitrate/sulfonate/bicarbonate transport system ATPase subunit
MAGWIEIDSLWKSFNGKTILSNITLRVDERERVGIVGPNGSGKTTLLRIIAGLEKGYSGKVIVEGSVSMVFQEDILLPWMTVYENIELGLKYRSIDEGERREIIYSISEDLGILSQLDQYPNVLSGGTRRKVSIARALALKPDILLLDEPFTGIDINTLDTLLNMLRKLPEKFDITLLIVSHQFAELAQVVDRLYVLSGYPSKISREIRVKDLSKEERLNEIIKAFQENID